MSSGQLPLERRRPTRYIVAALAGAAVVIVGLIVLALRGIGVNSLVDNSTAKDDPSARGREKFGRDPYLPGCRDVLQEFNAYLTQSDAPSMPELSKEQVGVLQKDLGLTPDEMVEVGSHTFTPLDGPHLEWSLLLRDVVLHTLTPERAAAAKTDPVESAAAAFAWVVRQVRLEEPTPGQPPSATLPPYYVLQRGSGTDLERALVFLALLEHLGDAAADPAGPIYRGCLVFCPDKSAADGKRMQFWACGFMIDDGPELYLFDPRLGLPLPGADGKGAATLAAAASDPAVLGQLTVDSMHPYDVTAEQAKKAEVHVVCNVSALSPRMRFLQDDLLKHGPRVRLAQDAAADFAAFRKAAGEGRTVKAASEMPGLLRRFLPPEEGGVDQPPVSKGGRGDLSRLMAFRARLAPLDYVPNVFRDQDKFPLNVGLGAWVWGTYIGGWQRLYVEPKSPRDLILRGKFDQAAAALTNADAAWTGAKEQLEKSPNLEPQVNAWVDKALPLFANQIRAKDKSAAEQAAADRDVQQVMSERTPVLILLEGAAATPMIPDVRYQMALCNQETAERLQLQIARADREEIRTKLKADAAAAWQNTLLWWRYFDEARPEEDPKKPATSPGRAAAARQLRGRALAASGQADSAAATFEDLTGPMSPLEQVAALYRARQVRK
jgi:hypothetical protein